MKERAPWCRSSALAHSLCSFARDPMTSSVLRVVIVGWNAFQRLYLAAGLPPLAVRLEEPLRCAQARRVPKRSEAKGHAGPVGRLRTRTSGSGLPPFAYSLCSFDRDLSRYARLASVATLRKVLTHSGWLRHPEVPRAARYPCTPVRAGCRSTLRDGTPSGRPPECWGINRREPPGRTRSGGVSTLRSVAKPPRPQGAPYSRG